MMANFKNKFAQFMYGRYGTDQLYTVSVVLCFILIFVNAFIHSSIINILVWAILIVSMFRSLSRNTYKRRIENEKFLKLWNPIKAKASLTVRRVKEIKTHRFRKCPNCKKVLRLPRKTGKHSVTCPCCHNEFKVHIVC